MSNPARDEGQTGQQEILIGDGRANPVAGALLEHRAPGIPSNIVDFPAKSIGITGAKMADPTREEIDAKIAASEARTETKLVRLEGKLDLVLSKLDDVRTGQRTALWNMWGLGLTLVILIAAIVALFPTFFGMGTSVRDLVDQAVQKALPHK